MSDLIDDVIDIDAWQQSELRRQLASAAAITAAPADDTQPTQQPDPSEVSEPIPDPTQPLAPSGVEVIPNPFGFDPIPGLDNLVQLWYVMEPNTELYRWQAEELYRISGYVDGTPSGKRIHWNSELPYFATYVCCNDSGKDIVLIRSTAIGLPLMYHDTLVVITSASHEQLKHQTNTPLELGLTRLAKRFGHPIYNSVEFYHKCESRGGEIKLFATDEAGRAEGWHPRSKEGRLVLLPNECKTVHPKISNALDRCHGVSHRIEVSSPGGRIGWFYNHWRKSDKFELGAKPTAWKYFSRKVTAADCPHIRKEAQQQLVDLHGEESFLVQTSLRANFHEEETNVAIPAMYVDNCEYVRQIEGEVALGLDCAAGGDKTVLTVRCGNYVADRLAFINPDIDASCDIIHERALPWKDRYVKFRVDDSGLGRGYSDGLNKRGWKIIKCHNQSPARNKLKFVNFGAECYGHCRDLFQAKKICAPTDDHTRMQLVTRKKVQNPQGKLKLQSKAEIKEEGGSSPDDGDSFTLAFYDYRPGFDNKPDPPPEDPTADVSSRPAQSFTEIARFFRKNPHLDLDEVKNTINRPLNERFYHIFGK